MHINNLKPYYPRLGYHYRLSNEPEDRKWAFKYKLKAADQAIFRGSYNEALVLLEKAYNVTESILELEILLQVVLVAIIDVKLANTANAGTTSSTGGTTGTTGTTGTETGTKTSSRNSFEADEDGGGGGGEEGEGGGGGWGSEPDL